MKPLLAICIMKRKKLSWKNESLLWNPQAPQRKVFAAEMGQVAWTLRKSVLGSNPGLFCDTNQ